MSNALPLLIGFFLAVCAAGAGWLLFRAGRFLFGTRGGNEGAIAKTKPSMRIYWIVWKLSQLWFRLYNRLCVEGAEHAPPRGPLVVVANHASILDGFLLGSCLPLPVFIMVKREAFDNPFSGWLLRKALAFPVDRSKPDASAIKTSVQVLQEGHALGLFPEGTRNARGLVRPFKPGAIRLAIRYKAPILPAFLDGNHLMSPPHTAFPRPAKLRVAFGPLMDVAALLAQGKTEKQISDLLYEEVVTLGQRLRGADVRDFSHPSPEGGESGFSPSPASASAPPSVPAAD